MVCFSSIESTPSPYERLTSLADLFYVYRCAFCLVSAPEIGKASDGSCTAPVMRAAEQMTECFRQGHELASSLSFVCSERKSPSSLSVAFTNLVDFAGSSSAEWCSTRVRSVRDGHRVMCSEDFHMDMREAFPDEPWDDTRQFEKAVENSMWFGFWRGKVSGGLAATLSAMQDNSVSTRSTDSLREMLINRQVPLLVVQGTEGVEKDDDLQRTVVVLSISGGPVTQVEQKSLPSLCRDVLSDLLRRKYSWAERCHIILAHFSTMAELIASFNGCRNLAVDPLYGGRGAWNWRNLDAENLARRAETSNVPVFRFDQACAPLAFRAVNFSDEHWASLSRPDAKSLFNLIDGKLQDPLLNAMTQKRFNAHNFRLAIGRRDIGAVNFMLESNEELLQEKFCIDGMRVSPLHSACASGNLDLVKAFVEKRADLHEYSSGTVKMNCLAWAVLGMQRGAVKRSNMLLDLVGYLLSMGVDPISRLSSQKHDFRLVDVLTLSIDVLKHGGPSQQHMVCFRNNWGHIRMVETLGKARDMLENVLFTLSAPKSIHTIFHEFDDAGNSKMSRDEFVRLYMYLGGKDSAHPNAVFDLLDTSQSSFINLSEFYHWVYEDLDVMNDFDWKPPW